MANSGTYDRTRTGAWLFLGFLFVLFANALASLITRLTFDVLGAVSELAIAVRAHDLYVVRYYNAIAFPLITTAVLSYVWPIIRHFRGGASETPPVVQRRVVTAPLVVAALGFLPWFVSCLLFPALTVYRLGHWSPDLVSQQVLSPLLNGFLAATTSYLLLDWLFRTRVAPVVPRVAHAGAGDALTFGVRARLLAFLVAVAFVPLFTMLGLVRAALVRVEAGVSAEAAMINLARASGVTFAVYVGLGVALTLLVARTLTKPLVDMAAALRRVRAGNLDVRVEVGSADELGVLEDGVNAMVSTLREREHILDTFGRVVEPSARDRLLAGELNLGGELRTVSVLFCDLRGFTSLAENKPPAEVVATLNEYFTTTTAWVRQCGGYVDKFIGDALLVVFGLFEGDAAQVASDGAAAALRCGLGMRDQLQRLNAERATRGREPLAVTIAIHTGEVVAGRIGAADRHEYTVIGDTVNVASRLQQLCKERGCHLLISEVTHQRAARSGYEPAVRARDSVLLRGRSEPVRVLELA